MTMARSKSMKIKKNEMITCCDCGKLAIFVCDLDWSAVDYTASGDRTEELIHGAKQYALCRECAKGSSDAVVAKMVAPRPWEQSAEITGSGGDGDED